MANSPSPVSMVSGPNKILLVVAVLMLIVGYAAGSMLSGGKGIIGDGCDDTAVRADLTKKLTDAGLIPTVMPITSLSGKITAIDENRLTLEVSNQNRNPLDAATPTVRVVTLGEGVAIKMLKPISVEDFQKSQETYNKQQEAFMAALNKGETATPPVPPSSFSEEEVKLSDIKVGMNATVIAAEDVRVAASFVATGVQVSDATAVGGIPGMAPAPSPTLPNAPVIAPPAAPTTATPGTIPMPTPAP